MTRYTFLSLLLKTRSPRIGCEIGLYFGDTTVFLLENFPQLFMIGIDPYLPYEGDKLSSTDLRAAKRRAFERLAKFDDRFEWSPEKDWKCCETFDFIFIDGNHSQAAVEEDLQWALQAIKPNGLIAGHDWTIPSVEKALSNFEQQFIITREYASNVWFITAQRFPTHSHYQ